jgi:hypothetical protein
MTVGFHHENILPRTNVFSASIQLPLVDGHPEPTIVAEEEIDFPIVQSDAIDRFVLYLPPPQCQHGSAPLCLFRRPDSHPRQACGNNRAFLEFGAVSFEDFPANRTLLPRTETHQTHNPRVREAAYNRHFAEVFVDSDDNPALRTSAPENLLIPWIAIPLDGPDDIMPVRLEGLTGGAGNASIE